MPRIPGPIVQAEALSVPVFKLGKTCLKMKNMKSVPLETEKCTKKGEAIHRDPVETLDFKTNPHAYGIGRGLYGGDAIVTAYLHEGIRVKEVKSCIYLG